MLKLFFLYNFSIALSTSIAGDKVNLEYSNSYHFSESNLVEVHLNNKKPFFIGLKEGYLSYNVGNNKKNHFILNKRQHKFFTKTDHIVSQSLLNWEMDNENLVIYGQTTSKSLFNYLFQECKKSESNIVLKIKTNTSNNEIHPCLGHLNSKPKVEAHLMLINKTRVQSKSLGLGAPDMLPWEYTQEGQLKLNEISGDLNASKSKNNSKGEVSFTGLLSVGRPLNFTNGLEVGIENPGANIFSRGNIEWKKLTSNITLDLKEFNKKQALIDVNFIKKSRTGETNTFRTESFKRSNQLKLNTWVKLLTYIENEEGKHKKSPLFISALGLRKKAKSRQEKELWIKLSHQEVL